ncbi:Imm49 family immunity protein [Pseudoalteromonas luteoviolacea]|uniref:Uncharacterized protein n=1 Tax=Pseudoalteromonas luteoviolacea S4060-1 TaxID=1365257 RepID=A0A167N813_9GAMM|nr:Imm49 family immunity protein [Pseudoalteromonas luteoviolacea]KZN67658.1 hypothetical protein N478_02545 [Pseudoalteromonas luteoviolacea S4060-1]
MTSIKIYPRDYADLSIYENVFQMVLRDRQRYIGRALSQLSELGAYATLDSIASSVNVIALTNYQHFRFFNNNEQLLLLISNLRLLCDIYRNAQAGRNLPSGDTLNVRVFETDIQLTRRPVSNWIDRNELCDQLSLAIIMRDQACINTLFSYTTDSVAEIYKDSYSRGAQEAYLEYVYTAMDEEIDHQAIHNKNMPIMDELLEGDYRFQLSLWRALGQLNQDKDLDAFEQAVIESFQAQSHIQKNDRELKDHMLPVMLLAPVCIAHDKYGYVPQHQNDYLPKWLLSGKFEKGIVEAE